VLLFRFCSQKRYARAVQSRLAAQCDGQSASICFVCGVFTFRLRFIMMAFLFRNTHLTCIRFAEKCPKNNQSIKQTENISCRNQLLSPRFIIIIITVVASYVYVKVAWCTPPLSATRLPPPPARLGDKLSKVFYPMRKTESAFTTTWQTKSRTRNPNSKNQTRTTAQAKSASQQQQQSAVVSSSASMQSPE
jgi:hypothetical protein